MVNLGLSMTALSFALASLALVPGAAVAREACSGAPHVLHAVTASKDATCVLTKLYEPAAFCLVDSNGVELTGTPFAIAAGHPTSFGMVFNDLADFNMEYALTCAANDGARAQSPKAIVTIGADGPGTPHISSVDLYGAQSSWASDGNQISITLQF